MKVIHGSLMGIYQHGSLYVYDVSLFWFVGWHRSSGLETKNLLICMKRDLVMPDMFNSSLGGPTTVVMVCSFIRNLGLSRCHVVVI